MAVGGRGPAGRLRELFSRERSFQGADIELARRFSKVGWPIGALIGFGLVPFYPPTAEIGNAGWAYTALDGVLTAAWIVYLYRCNARVTFNTLLFTAYFGLFNVVAAQWLAGGLPAPYHELYPFMILAAASVHPPRRFFPFLAVLLAGAIVPEVGSGNGAQIGDLVTELLLWLGASTLVLAVIWKIRRQRAERDESHAEAYELARVDPLTGLGNRRAFEETVATEISRARRSEIPLSLLICDLDSFKKINDVHGHLAGDDCLRQVADALRGELRGGDVCFRWGGDEFVVVLAGAGELAALEVAARVEARVAASCARPDETPLHVTCGHAVLLDWMSAHDLLAVADRALLSRKDRAGASAQPAS
jgi:diguanylate cyclase (GGDEF)-like protein